MEIEIIKTCEGDKEGSIDTLIEFLKDAKDQGATHFKMTWSQDPDWAFKWFDTYRIKSEDEFKKEKREKLQKELDSLN